MKNFFYILFKNKVTIIKAAYARLQMTQHPCNNDSIQTIDSYILLTNEVCTLRIQTRIYEIYT